MNFSLSFAARAAGAPPPAEDAALSGACVDSREAGPGKLFFALAGARADGHDFVGEVLDAGGSAMVSREGWSGRVVRVGDVGEAMLEVARAIREGWSGRDGGGGGPRTVIGVTGSSGKTTTRHLIEMALSPAMRTGGTRGNLNNHIGLPLSVMNLDPEAEVAVLEAGMNHEGELRRLGRVIAPDVSVVTCIGRAHLEYFGSLEAVARAKAELLEETRPGGRCFIPPGWSALEKVASARSLRIWRVGPGGDSWLEQSPSGYRAMPWGEPLRLGARGRHFAEDALTALSVAASMGVGAVEAIEAMSSFDGLAGRGRRLAYGLLTVIDESYNANPDSMRACLESLACEDGRRIAVLGDMLELGADSGRMHDEVLRLASSLGLDLVVLVGSAFAAAAGCPGRGMLPVGTWEEALAVVEREAAREATVLVKGSRAMRLDQLVERLRGDA